MSIEDSVNQMVRQNAERDRAQKERNTDSVINLADQLYKYIYDEIVREIAGTQVYDANGMILGVIMGSCEFPDILDKITSYLFRVETTKKKKGILLPEIVYKYTLIRQDTYWDVFFHRFNLLIRQEKIDVTWSFIEHYYGSTMGAKSGIITTRFDPGSFKDRTFSNRRIDLELQYHYHK